MNLIFLFALLVLALLFLLLKSIRLALALLILALTNFALVGAGFIPNLLLLGLQIHPHLENPQWKQKNLIVVLTGGAVHWPDSDHFGTQIFASARVLETIKLYNDCKNNENSRHCRVLITGGDPAGHGTSEAGIMQTELMNSGIPGSDILTETKSLNTFENASKSVPLIRAEAPERLVLVTSGTHMSRALMMFSNFGVEALPAPADHFRVTQNWKYLYSNFFIADLAFHEYIGQLRFLFSK